MNENIIDLNNKLKNKRPDEIVSWAINQYENPILTTNFRPYECTILHLCSTIMPEIKVVWCDSGYNTKATYKYAEKIIKRFNLNIHIYVPKLTKEFSNHNDSPEKLALYLGEDPKIITYFKTFKIISKSR